MKNMWYGIFVMTNHISNKMWQSLTCLLHIAVTRLFVGDSISNNMWQPLTCLLHIAVPNSNYTLTSQTKELLVFSISVVIFFSFTFSFLESIELL